MRLPFFATLLFASHFPVATAHSQSGGSVLDRDRMMAAVREGNVTVVRSYVSRGVPTGNAVSIAAAHCRVGVVRYLVQEGRSSTSGAFPFLMQCKNEEDVEDILAILLPVATVERPDYDLAMSLARQNGFRRVVPQMANARVVEARPDPPRPIEEFWAALERRKSIDEFLKQGIDPNIRNAAGVPALIVATQRNHVEAVYGLLAKGADPDIRDRTASRAVDHAERLSERADSFKAVRGVLRFRNPLAFAEFNVNYAERQPDGRRPKLAHLRYKVDDVALFIRSPDGRKRFVTSFSPSSADSAGWQVNIWTDRNTPLNVPIFFDLEANVYRADYTLAAHRTERVKVAARERNEEELEGFAFTLPSLPPGEYRLHVALIEQRWGGYLDHHLQISNGTFDPTNILAIRAFSVGREVPAGAPSLSRPDEYAGLPDAARVFRTDNQRAVESMLAGAWSAQIAGFSGSISFERVTRGMIAKVVVNGGANGTIEETGRVEVQQDGRVVIRGEDFRWIREPSLAVRMAKRALGAPEYILGTYEATISPDGYGLSGTVKEQIGTRSAQWSASKQP